METVEDDVRLRQPLLDGLEVLMTRRLSSLAVSSFRSTTRSTIRPTVRQLMARSSVTLVLSVICSRYAASSSKSQVKPVGRRPRNFFVEDTAVGALDVSRGIGEPDDQPAQRQV